MGAYGLRIGPVREGHDAGPIIQGATVSGEIESAQTGPDGRAVVDALYVTVTAPGFKPYEHQRYVRPSLEGPTFPIALQRGEPAPIGLPRIHVDGLGFRDERDQPWTWAMTDGFLDYFRFLQGEDLRPVLEQARELGSNGRRVLGMVDSFEHWYPQQHPDYYDRIGPFLDLLAEYRQYAQFCVFADTRIVMPDRGQQQDHYWRVCDQLRTRPNVFLELVNENNANQNGVDVERFGKPDGITASIGSNGTGFDPPQPFWDYCDLGCERRDGARMALGTTTVQFTIHGYAGEHGAPSWPGTQRATVNSEPPGFAEDSRGSSRTNDPQIAYLLGIGCRFGAGGTAHSDAGIESVLLGPRQADCVREFLRGVQG